MMSGMPAAPELVEVVASDDVEPAMAAIAEELDDLAGELASLLRRAEVLERRAAEGRDGGGDRALTILEQVFHATAAATRAELDASYARAESAAEERLATARREAEAMTRERQAQYEIRPRPAATSMPSSPDVTTRSAATPRPAPSPPGRAPAPIADRRPTADHLRLVRHRGHRPPENPVDCHDAPLPAPADQYEVAPPPPPERHPPHSATSGVPPSPARLSVPAPPSVPAGDGFAQFWVGDRRSAPAPRPRFAVLDVVLPVFAAGIIFMIILSWMG